MQLMAFKYFSIYLRSFQVIALARVHAILCVRIYVNESLDRLNEFE